MIEASKCINKITLRFEFVLLCSIVFLLTPFLSAAQDSVLNKYGLWVIPNVKVLQKTIRKNPDKQMVNVTTQVPGVILDLRYCTSNNFMQQMCADFFRKRRKINVFYLHGGVKKICGVYT